MTNEKNISSTEDVEGNMPRIRFAPDAEPVADTEGNGYRYPAPVADVEGNGSMHWSDAEIKHDVTPVSKPVSTSDDTEGNGRREPGMISFRLVVLVSAAH